MSWQHSSKRNIGRWDTYSRSLMKKLLKPDTHIQKHFQPFHFMQTSQNITFKKLGKQEYGEFKNDVKNIFSIAVIESFGETYDKETIVPDSDINMSLYNPQCETLAVYADGKKVAAQLSGLITSRNTTGWICFTYIQNNTAKASGFRYGKVWKKDIRKQKCGA